VERYDILTDTWEPVASMSIPRRALAAVTLNDGVYAVGGFDGTNCLASVERYDDAKGQWVFTASMSIARCTHAATPSSDLKSLLVFGGFNNGALNNFEQYSIDTQKWKSMASMLQPRFMHAAITVPKLALDN
jgi:N-acetylneuraminic acid mutarotase